MAWLTHRCSKESKSQDTSADFHWSLLCFKWGQRSLFPQALWKKMRRDMGRPAPTSFSATLHTVTHVGDSHIRSLNLPSESKWPEEDCCSSLCDEQAIMIYWQFIIIDSINCPETVPLFFFLELPVNLSLDPVPEHHQQYLFRVFYLISDAVIPTSSDAVIQNTRSIANIRMIVLIVFFYSLLPWVNQFFWLGYPQATFETPCS